MMSWDEEQKLIADTIAEFPATFGLRAFAGDVFRISPRSSYVNDSGVVMLYTERYNDTLGKWQSFAKGNKVELRRELVKVTA